MSSNTVSKAARTTPVIRVSYPTLFTPRAVNPGDTPKYGIVLMFDKKDQTHMDYLKAMYKDLQECLVEKWPDPAKRPGTPIQGGTFSPLKDGDKTVNKNNQVLCAKNPEYAGYHIVRVNTTTKPVVVDANRQEVLDPNKIYGGCFCKVSANAYTFVTPTSSGVTVGLNGVQFIADGESFGGGRPPMEDMFAEEAAAGAASYVGEPDPFQEGPPANAGGGPLDMPEDDIPF